MSVGWLNRLSGIIVNSVCCWATERNVIIKTNHECFVVHYAFVKKSHAIDLIGIGDISLISYIFLITHSPIKSYCLDCHNSNVFPIDEV